MGRAAHLQACQAHARRDDRALGAESPRGLAEARRGRRVRSSCALASPAGAVATAPSLNGNLRSALAVPGIAPSQSAAVAIDLATGQIALRAEPRHAAPAGVEREALRHVRGARRARPDLPLPHRGARRGPAGRPTSGTGDSCSRATATRRSRRRTSAASPTGSRRAGIRRVTGRVVGDESWFDAPRTAPGWNAVVLHRRSRRRSRRSSSTAAGTTAGRSRDPALAAAGAVRPHAPRARRPRRATRRPGRAARERDRGSRRSTRGGSRAIAAGDRPRERQLHRRDAAEGARRARCRQGHDRPRAPPSSGATSPPPASRSPASAIVDGSGLSRANRVTARALAALLARDLERPERAAGSCATRSPVAGMTGTLAHRLQHRPARGARAREDRHDQRSPRRSPATSATATRSSSSRTARRSRPGRPARRRTASSRRSPGSRRSASRRSEQRAQVVLGEERHARRLAPSPPSSPGSRRRPRRSSSSRRCRRPSRRAPRAPPSPPRA